MNGPADPSRRGVLHGLFWFVAFNTVALLMNAWGYLSVAPDDASMTGWLFLRVALVAQVATLSVLAGLVLALLVIAAGPRRAPNLVAPVAAFLYVGLQFFLLVDRKQYALFRFHLNGLALNVISTPGGWESMHVGTSDLVLVAVVLLAVLLAEAFAFRALLRRHAVTPDGIRVRRRWTLLLVPVILLATGERATYAWADLENVRDVTRSARVVPLYQPFTVKRIARKFFGIQVNKEGGLTAPKAGGSLKYPRAALTFHAPERTPNILWLTLDSFRYDALDPAITPRIAQAAARGFVFENHLSGGNATRYGVFTMFYGLHGSYWQTVLADRRGPVLVSRLKELGYSMKILSSTSLTWPEFRKTAFVEIPDAIEDGLPGPRTKDKDRQLTERLDVFLDGHPQEKPFFAWLFFDSSHAPYDLEESQAKFTPYAESVSYTNLESLKTDLPAREKMHNRYRNGVAYLDGLVGKVLDDLDRRGLSSNTIVVITGDHGEEYFEHGFFGHNGAFTPEQIHVPLVVIDPARGAGRVTRMTSSQDLVPTFMELLGVANPPADYALGENLFSTEPQPHVISCAWSECAVVDSSGWMVFGTETYNASGVDVLDRDYKLVDDPKPVLRAKAPELVGIMSELSAFLK
ncbi:MAG TPA: sulfatase-like hydrolase/transferase [bacterium]|nr:sulfatase-like hydrolase/transferase [bacterium]